MQLDLGKIFLDAFLQPVVLRVLGFGILAVFALTIFRILVDRVAKEYFKKHPPKRIKTSTLLIVFVVLLISIVILLQVMTTRPATVMMQGQLEQQVDQQTSTLARGDSVQGNSLAQQLKIKFSLDIMRFWQVDEVFQYPRNPYIFYYISEDSSGFHIGRFDAGKDKNYLQDESPNIPAYNAFVYSEKLASDNEFRGAGFDGEKFVFIETERDNSPGPCATPWLYGKHSYIDVDINGVQKKPYVLAGQKLQEINKQVADCEKEFE